MKTNNKKKKTTSKGKDNDSQSNRIKCVELTFVSSTAMTEFYYLLELKWNEKKTKKSKEKQKY